MSIANRLDKLEAAGNDNAVLLIWRDLTETAGESPLACRAFREGRPGQVRSARHHRWLGRPRHHPQRCLKESIT
jgi:hypothetical protein